MKRFLCVGGPLHNQWKTHAEAGKAQYYYQYNNSGGGPLSAVFVWLSVVPKK